MVTLSFFWPLSPSFPIQMKEQMTDPGPLPVDWPPLDPGDCGLDGQGTLAGMAQSALLMGRILRPPCVTLGKSLHLPVLSIHPWR